MKEREEYHKALETSDQLIAELIAETIDNNLPGATSKIWHAHPVWFLNDNPIVGYSKQKKGLRLMFWSGADFEENKLEVLGGKFKDASIFYQTLDEVEIEELKRWLKKSISIQWDYKNLVKRKGKLERLLLSFKS